MIKNKFGIYVHIPFCMSKCSYCSFVSKCANEEEIESYFKALNKQINIESNMFKTKIVNSIYFGGGTPSYVNEKYILEVLTNIKKNFNIAENVEISIECNPCSTTKEKLIAYKFAGVNRISFGVQSLNNTCLAIIGRKHNKDIALNAIKLAKDVGFENISADLLIGIPMQTKETLINDINELVKLDIKHISAYMLMLEKGTKLYEQTNILHTVKIASDNDCVDMYDSALNVLKNNGFGRYEISNFAVGGYECKHNINYWQMGEYVGFGLAAHSYYNNKRISGFNNFKDYYSYVDNLQKLQNFNNETLEQSICDLLIDNVEYLTNAEIIVEYIMLGLRMKQGIDIKQLLLLGYDIINEKREMVSSYLKNNIIQIENNNLSICENMFGASNQIILNLMP